ncbi:MAG TPA: sigma-70 family RNA polymerase sigma factor [Polyangiaceae bacterium]|nr:sigma-70 family RNA polymerase sigma factor [Polyangiaceae bacterium]
MEAPDREALEGQIRAHCDAGDKKRAATLLLEGYGREVFAFLLARLRDHDAASEVFSQFTEDLWKGLDGFRWQCSARVWAYTLVRHAASRFIADARRREAGKVPLSGAGPLSAIEQRIRTATLASARTEMRSRLAELRESLPVEEQTLLILRVNRKLDWKEIACVMSYEGEVVTDEALEKEAVRLRKRFQIAKERLRRIALEKGLIPPKNDQ